jgi:hypothetical protein
MLQLQDGGTRTHLSRRARPGGAAPAARQLLDEVAAVAPAAAAGTCVFGEAADDEHGEKQEPRLQSIRIIRR